MFNLLKADLEQRPYRSGAAEMAGCEAIVVDAFKKIARQGDYHSFGFFLVLACHGRQTMREAPNPRKCAEYVAVAFGIKGNGNNL